MPTSSRVLTRYRARICLCLLAVIAGCAPRPGKPSAQSHVQANGTAADGKQAKSGPTASWAAAGVNWENPPRNVTVQPFVAPVPVEFTLSNGIRVQLIENHRLPLISMSLILPFAGTYNEGAKAGLADITATLVSEATQNASAMQLPEVLETLGASLTLSATTRATTLRMSTLPETFGESCALAADVLLRPALLATDFARVRDDVLEAIARRGDDPSGVARLAFMANIFRGKPPGRPVLGYAKTVRVLKLADVQRFWRDHYGATHMVIFLAGDLDQATAAPLLESAFGKMAATRRSKALAPSMETPVPSQAIAVIDRPGAAQTNLVAGRPGPSWTSRDRGAEDIANSIVGGSFASRLNSKLREELGYTYGVGSRFQRTPNAGLWLLSTALKTSVTGPALEAALAVLATMKTPVPDEELAKAKQLTILSQPQDFETNAGLVAQMQLAHLAGLSWSAATSEYADAVAKVTAADVQKAANFGGLFFVLVGDWQSIETSIRPLAKQLRLPIRFLDQEGNVLSKRK